MTTQSKVNQLKSVAVAIVRNEEGEILLIEPHTQKMSLAVKDLSWELPASEVIPGSSYTESFASFVLEKSGYIVEATGLISSEKAIKSGIQYEYVECKIVHRDILTIKQCSRKHKWVHPAKLKKHFFGKVNKDLKDFFEI